MTEFLEIKGTGSIRIQVYTVFYLLNIINDYILLYRATVGINHTSTLMRMQNKIKICVRATGTKGHLLQAVGTNTLNFVMDLW